MGRGRPKHPDILTPREWEVLALVREGLTNQEIADRLGITLPGARYHVSEILSKLGVATREEAAAWQPEEAPAGNRWALALLGKIAIGAGAALAIGGIAVLVWGTISGGTGEGSTDSDKGSSLVPPSDNGIYRVTEGSAATFVGPYENLTVSQDRAWYAYVERPENLDKGQDVYLSSASGQEPTLIGHFEAAVYLSISPDASQVAVLGRTDRSRTTNVELFVVDVSSTAVSFPPTREEIVATGPIQWSPDAEEIAFIGHDNSTEGLYLVDPVSWDFTRVLEFSPELQPCSEFGCAGFGAVSDFAWSPGGETIAISFPYGPDPGVFLLDVATGEIEKLTDTVANGTISWSPDGSEFAFDDSPQDTPGIIPTGEPEPELPEWHVRVFDLKAREERALGAGGQANWSSGSDIAFIERGTLKAVDADGSNERVLLSAAPCAFDPLWLANGDVLVKLHTLPVGWGCRQ